jgi:hypothetical protein
MSRELMNSSTTWVKNALNRLLLFMSMTSLTVVRQPEMGDVGREVQETTPPSNVLALSRPCRVAFHSAHLRKVLVFFRAAEAR